MDAPETTTAIVDRPSDADLPADGHQASSYSLKIEPQQPDADDDQFCWLPKTVTVCDLVAKVPDSDVQRCIGNLFLVGTSHFSRDSQDDVKKVIQTTQPDVVMVELCPNRASMLSMNEEELLATSDGMSTFEIVRSMVSKYGRSQGLVQAALVIVSSHLTRQLGMAPGGEFRVAYQETLALKECMFVLGDRPVSITLRRAMASLSLWNKLKLLFGILRSVNETVTPDEVERMKDGDILEELLRSIGGEFPALTRALLSERDEFMAFMCNKIVQGLFEQRLAQGRTSPMNVVAVVGLGHVKGISKNLGKRIPVLELLSIPTPKPPSPVYKGIKLSVILGVTCYFGYRIVRRFR